MAGRLLVAVALALAVEPGLGVAQDNARFFRIATGPTAGTYFQIGGLIASAISSPPGSRACDVGGTCGVENLIAVTQSTGGSQDNVLAIASGSVESALAQADVSWWAYSGTGVFADQGPMDSIRTIASLYPEKVHVVVRADSEIASIEDLAGHSVSLGPEGSGVGVNAAVILAAFGLEVADLVPLHFKPGAAADALRAGELDAFFLISGEPVNAIADLARNLPIRLLQIAPDIAAKIIEDQPFFTPSVIDTGVYEGVERVYTLSLGAQWLVSAEADEDLVYEVTRALWNPRTLELLRNGHPKGRLIRLETAIDGLGAPLHPGAARFYAEQKLFDPIGQN